MAITIVMYHYIRDLQGSRFPGIKGLELDLFRAQLSYLERHYTMIRMEDLIAAFDGGPALPERAALLTFDDGFIDHFEFVFPLLDARGIQGSFFPPAAAIAEHKLLDAHKLHFILAAVPDSKALSDEVSSLVEKFREEFGLESAQSYFMRLAKPGRFDPGEVVFVKRLLQRELTGEARRRILGHLFDRHVGIDDEIFARELYMTMDQLQCMQRKGMHIGSHGYNHSWLGSLRRAEKEQEIELSLEFLEAIGVDRSTWTLCYPYGDHDLETRELLAERGCKVAVTTQVAVASLENDDPLALPRLDTNDLPKDARAKTDDWYALA